MSLPGVSSAQHPLRVLLPTATAKTPEVPSLEAGKTIFGHRGHQVVPLIATELEECLCHLRADSMLTNVVGTRITKTSSKEASHRFAAASTVASQNVSSHLEREMIRYSCQIPVQSDLTGANDETNREGSTSHIRAVYRVSYYSALLARPRSSS